MSPHSTAHCLICSIGWFRSTLSIRLPAVRIVFGWTRKTKNGFSLPRSCLSKGSGGHAWRHNGHSPCSAWFLEAARCGRWCSICTRWREQRLPRPLIGRRLWRQVDRLRSQFRSTSWCWIFRGTPRPLHGWRQSLVFAFSFYGCLRCPAKCRGSHRHLGGRFSKRPENRRAPRSQRAGEGRKDQGWEIRGFSAGRHWGTAADLPLPSCLSRSHQVSVADPHQPPDRQAHRSHSSQD